MRFRNKNIALLRVVSMLCLVLSSCQDRIDHICSGFGINLQQIEYNVVEKTEKWYPNGDGELFILLSFPTAQDGELNDISSQMSDSGAIEMPMLKQHKKIMSGKGIGYVRGLDSGLYLMDIDKSDSRNYSLIVYNEAKKELAIQIIVY